MPPFKRPLVGTPRDPPKVTCEQVSQAKSDEGHLIAGYPEGGRLWRFMINCMDKTSSMSSEGLWDIRLLTNQHRVDSSDRERTWANIMGYSSLCRQQWMRWERNRMSNSGQRKMRRGGGGGSVSHWNNIWTLLWWWSGKPWNRWGRHRDMVQLKCVNNKRRNPGWQVKYNLMYSPLSLNGHLYKTDTSVKRTPRVGPRLS